jgi:hypothetical protein
MNTPTNDPSESSQRPALGANVERLARLLFWLIALYLGGKLLMAGASLCSTAMSELTERLPGLASSADWFEWGDIPALGERLHASLADDHGRVARAAEAQRVARENLSWSTLAEDVLAAAARHFHIAPAQREAA